MTEQWNQLKEIFHAAVQLPIKERAAFLHEHCNGDAEMLRELQLLLESHDEAEHFIEKPALVSASEILPGGSDEPWSGRTIGHYRVEREIGRGGMGVVLLAVRDDEQYKKSVAIKLLRRGMDTEDILRRFRNERQILASLEHPHIARLIDGGMTDDGLPYFVLEYIEGEPIDAYCDQHKLSTNQRLALFSKVCAAVQYAHQNLIVHRDLKPSNILVTTEGEPKLLDFGIAKLLNSELAAEAIAPTATQLRLMTPDYASPEQIRGKSIMTASDIYSLGVLLYRLLSGHPPYRLVDSSPQEIERLVCDVEPERPSTAISRTEEITINNGVTRITPESVGQTRNEQPDALRRRLRGDLDNIVLMAMRKEPERRYQSAAQLSDDIRRYMDGLPVGARKNTFVYRASKFIRRNRIGVAAAALVLIAILGGLTASIWQARVARQQRDAAQRERVKAEKINLFLQEMLGSPIISQKGHDVKVIEMLDESVQRAGTEFANQPDVLADVYLTLGASYLQLSNFAAAEKYLRASVDLNTKTRGGESAQTAYAFNQLAGLMYQRASYAESEAFCRRSTDIYRKLGNGAEKNVADNLVLLGLLLADKGQLDGAEATYGEALALYRKLNLMETADATTCLNNLGRLYDHKGDLDKAVLFYNEAISILRKLPAANSQTVLATTLQNLGAIYKLKGDYAAAEPLIREAIDLRRRLLGEKHPFVAIAQCHLADLFYRKGEYDKAEQEARSALSLQKATLPDGHVDIARSLLVLGQTLTAKGELIEAEMRLREAVEIRRKSMTESNPVLPQTESVLGECLAAEKKYDEAQGLLVGSYNRLKAIQGDKNPNTLEALRRVVKLYEAWKKPQQAEQFKTLLDNAAR